MCNLYHFVHVIESPSSVDLLDGRTEGRSLCAFLDLAEIPNTYCLATDVKTFQLAITERMVNGMEKHKAFPIIHISAHGNESGIALTNNHLIHWPTLSMLFQPITSIMNQNLMVCLSSCYGTSATKMAIEAESLPISKLIACEGEVEWHQGVIAYVTFYTHFLKIGAEINNAVAAMNTACGRSDFKDFNVSQLYTFVRYLRQLNPEQIDALMEKLKQTLVKTERN